MVKFNHPSISISVCLTCFIFHSLLDISVAGRRRISAVPRIEPRQESTTKLHSLHLTRLDDQLEDGFLVIPSSSRKKIKKYPCIAAFCDALLVDSMCRVIPCCFGFFMTFFLPAVLGSASIIEDAVEDATIEDKNEKIRMKTFTILLSLIASSCGCSFLRMLSSLVFRFSCDSVFCENVGSRDIRYSDQVHRYFADYSCIYTDVCECRGCNDPFVTLRPFVYSAPKIRERSSRDVHAFICDQLELQLAQGRLAMAWVLEEAFKLLGRDVAQTIERLLQSSGVQKRQFLQLSFRLHYLMQHYDLYRGIPAEDVKRYNEQNARRKDNIFLENNNDLEIASTYQKNKRMAESKENQKLRLSKLKVLEPEYSDYHDFYPGTPALNP